MFAGPRELLSWVSHRVVVLHRSMQIRHVSEVTAEFWTFWEAHQWPGHWAAMFSIFKSCTSFWASDACSSIPPRPKCNGACAMRSCNVNAHILNYVSFIVSACINLHQLVSFFRRPMRLLVGQLQLQQPIYGSFAKHCQSWSWFCRWTRKLQTVALIGWWLRDDHRDYQQFAQETQELFKLLFQGDMPPPYLAEWL